MSKSAKKTKDIDAVDKHGWTALHHAAREGDMNEVKRLLAAGANVDARTTALAHDSTPLVIATRSKHFDIMRLLLDRGADIEARDNEGYGGQKKTLGQKKHFIRSNNVAQVSAVVPRSGRWTVEER